MPFVLVIIGIALLTSGVRNTQDDLYALVKGDFAGQNNYIYWAGSILAVGAVGYIKPLKPVANSFLVLLVIVLLIGGDRGTNFFSRITQALKGTESAGSGTPAPTTTPATDPAALSKLSDLTMTYFN